MGQNWRIIFLVGKGCKKKKNNKKSQLENTVFLKRSYLMLELGSNNVRVPMQHFHLSVYWSSNNVIKGKVSLISLGYRVKQSFSLISHHEEVQRSPSAIWHSRGGADGWRKKLLFDRVRGSQGAGLWMDSPCGLRSSNKAG